VPDLTVLIPTLNEAGPIGRLVAQVRQTPGLDVEVVVADGGSTDGTPQVAAEAGARVVESPPGRGRQLNRGRAVARAPLLCILHADSRLTSPDQLTRAVAVFRSAASESKRPVAGHFQLRFFDHHSRALTYYEGLSALGRPQTVNGDQGLLIETDQLDALGGFHETWPFLEDQDLGQKIDRLGQWVLLPGRLETSARRFQVEGTTARSIHNAVTMAFFSFRYAPFLSPDGPRTNHRYRQHDQSRRLRVAPLGREVFGLLLRQPSTLLPLAHYVNRHALWRLAFWLDVRRQGDRAADHHPMLDRYDRWCRWTHHPLVDLCWMLPTLVAFFAVWTRFELYERPRNKP
jgi:glycosyltransferase involved in cell wall biosynthesis